MRMETTMTPFPPPQLFIHNPPGLGLRRFLPFAAATCLREQTIRDLQRLLIESASQFVVVLDRVDGKVLGLVTLHDLLRAEVEKGKGDDD
jgi:CBS domain-containing protein